MTKFKRLVLFFGGGALALTVMFAHFLFFLQAHFVAAAVVLFTPPILFAIIDWRWLDRSLRTNRGMWFALATILPISVFFLVWQVVNHTSLIWAWVGAASAAFVAWQLDQRRWRFFGPLTWLTWFQVLLGLVIFAAVPSSHYYEFKSYENIKWSKLESVLAQPGVMPLVYTELLGGRKFCVHRSGLRRPCEAFDPYLIRCRPPATIYVQHELLDLIQSIDLTTLEAKHMPSHGSTLFFFDSENPGVAYTGPSFYPYREAQMLTFDTDTMKVVSQDSLYRPQWDDHSPFYGAFRMGFTTRDRIYVLTENGRLLRFTRTLQPEALLNLPSVGAFFNTIHYEPANGSAYAAYFPLLTYHIDVQRFRLVGVRFSPMVLWIDTVPERHEVLVNGVWSVDVLDDQTLRTKRSIRSKFGIRNFAYDRQRQRLYIPSYFSGELGAYDYLTGRYLGSVFAGPILRAVYYCPSTDRIYAGSSLGVFEVNPDAFVAPAVR